MTDKEVSAVIRVLRPVLIVLVVLAHIPWTHNNPHTRDFTLSIQSFLLAVATGTIPAAAVPTLSLISGYLGYSSYQRRKYLGTILEKLRKLILPLVFWNLVMALYIVWLQSRELPMRKDLALYAGSAYDWLRALTAHNSIPANPPLYFLHDLFISFLLMPVAFLLIRSRLATSAAIAVLGAMTIARYNPPFIVRVDIPFWFFVGLAAAHFGIATKIAISRTTALYMALLALVLAAVTTLVAFTNLKFMYAYLLKVFNLFGPPTVLALALNYYSTAPGRILANVSKYSFTLFLTHAFVIAVFSEFWGRATHVFVGRSYVVAPLLMFATMAAVAFCCYHLYHLALSRAGMSWRPAKPERAGQID